ncbi:hypothetical protein [Sphingomonas sp. CROZ-RG-20F-R02-07]|uniref:hypothetical protein n=1 Tax=Sphingomonas sp. CROZ-RG-20F-R02-07 TaxID=2914832 RepID=UPI001F566913|nr:hypothetical protein [Sphingomonas sp. CROZ-RG-20F-R02-07]
MTRLALRRTAEMAAVFMIGDGLLGLLQPRRHVDLWRSDVAAVDALVKPFGGAPGRRRAYGLLQIGAGVLLASRLRPLARGVLPQ